MAHLKRSFQFIFFSFNDPSENSLNMILALAPILIHFPPFRQMNQRTMNDVSAILGK